MIKRNNWIRLLGGICCGTLVVVMVITLQTHRSVLAAATLNAYREVALNPQNATMMVVSNSPLPQPATISAQTVLLTSFDGTDVATNATSTSVMPLVSSGSATYIPARFGSGRVIRPPVTNLIQNPEFKVDTTLWRQTFANAATLTRDTSRQAVGTAALKVTTPGNQYGEGIWNEVNMRCTPNARYTFSVYLQGTGTVILQANAQPGILGSAQVTLTPTWHRYAFSFDANASANCGVGITTPSGLPGQAITFWASGFQVEPGNEATTFVDGDSPGCHWLGQSNASASSCDGNLLTYPLNSWSQQQGLISAWFLPSWNGTDLSEPTRTLVDLNDPSSPQAPHFLRVWQDSGLLHVRLLDKSAIPAAELATSSAMLRRQHWSKLTVRWQAGSTGTLSLLDGNTVIASTPLATFDPATATAVTLGSEVNKDHPAAITVDDFLVSADGTLPQNPSPGIDFEANWQHATSYLARSVTGNSDQQGTLFVQNGDSNHQLLANTQVSIPPDTTDQSAPIRLTQNLVLFQNGSQRWALDRQHCFLVSMQGHDANGIWQERIADPYAPDYQGGFRVWFPDLQNSALLNSQQHCTLEQQGDSIISHLSGLLDNQGTVRAVPTTMTAKLNPAGLSMQVTLDTTQTPVSDAAYAVSTITTPDVSLAHLQYWQGELVPNLWNNWTNNALVSIDGQVTTNWNSPTFASGYPALFSAYTNQPATGLVAVIPDDQAFPTRAVFARAANASQWEFSFHLLNHGQPKQYTESNLALPAVILAPFTPGGRRVWEPGMLLAGQAIVAAHPAATINPAATKLAITLSQLAVPGVGWSASYPLHTFGAMQSELANLPADFNDLSFLWVYGQGPGGFDNTLPDYFPINNQAGGETALKSLFSAAHQRHIRTMLYTNADLMETDGAHFTDAWDAAPRWLGDFHYIDRNDPTFLDYYSNLMLQSQQLGADLMQMDTFSYGPDGDSQQQRLYNNKLLDWERWMGLGMRAQISAVHAKSTVGLMVEGNNPVLDQGVDIVQSASTDLDTLSMIRLVNPGMPTLADAVGADKTPDANTKTLRVSLLTGTIVSLSPPTDSLTGWTQMAQPEQQKVLDFLADRRLLQNIPGYPDGYRGSTDIINLPSTVEASTFVSPQQHSAVVILWNQGATPITIHPSVQLHGINDGSITVKNIRTGQNVTGDVAVGIGTWDAVTLAPNETVLWLVTPQIVSSPTPTATPTQPITAVLEVGTNQPYTTIQAAIDAIPSTLTQPYVINIHAGTYTSASNPIVNIASKTTSTTNTITLKANGSDTVILDGQGSRKAIYASIGNLVIKGLTIKDGMDHGILLFPSDNSQVLENYFVTSLQPSYWRALSVIESKNVLVRNNTFYGYGVNAIWNGGGSNTLIDSNTIYHTGSSGILINTFTHPSTNVLVKNNSISDCIGNSGNPCSGTDSIGHPLSGISIQDGSTATVQTTLIHNYPATISGSYTDGGGNSTDNPAFTSTDPTSAQFLQLSNPNSPGNTHFTNPVPKISTLQVGTNQPYTTIQAAIDAIPSTLNQPYVVNIHAGTYTTTGNAVATIVNKTTTAVNQITLQANNQEQVILDGQNTHRAVVANVNNVTINGLQIKNATDHGILLGTTACNNDRIINNYFYTTTIPDNWRGLSIIECNNVTVQNNTFYGYGVNAIWNGGADNTIIDSNTIYNTSNNGILINTFTTTSDNIIVKNNIISTCAIYLANCTGVYGVDLASGSTATLSNNDIFNYANGATTGSYTDGGGNSTGNPAFTSTDPTSAQFLQLSNPNSPGNTHFTNPLSQGSSLSQGLVGYWKLDESSWNGTAGEVKDSSGNGNNGRAVCNAVGCTVPTTASGKFGNGGSFSGSTSVADTVSIPNNNVFSFGIGPFAASVWVKTTDTYGSIWAKGADPSMGMSITLGKVKFNTYSGGANAVIGTTSVNDGNWHHIVGVRDNSNLYIYVDGKLDATTTSVGKTVNSNMSIGIAGGDIHDVNADLAGTIDELRIYNRALSPTDVSNLYNFIPGG